MESTSGFLHLRVISCKSLAAFNFFQKLSVYAIVSVADDGDRKLSQRTPTDREGDGNPEWNHTMRLELQDELFRECDKYFLHFDLYHEGVMFGDKFIGEVVVPLLDLIQESNGTVRFVTYQVRTRDGKSNGELNFSFQVKIGKDQGLKMESPASVITGYPLLLPHPNPSPEPEPDSEAQFCSSELGNGSPRIQYPVLDLQDMLVQGPEFHSSSSGKQDLNPIQESSYFLPQNGYYQLPTPPPPPRSYPPPPPAAIGQGGPYFYRYPPPPPGSYMWGPAPYAAHDASQLGPVDGTLETWSNGWAAVRGNYHSSAGNSCLVRRGHVRN